MVQQGRSTKTQKYTTYSILPSRAGEIVSSVNLGDIFIYSRHVCPPALHTAHIMHDTDYILHTTYYTLISEDWTLHQVAGDYGCLYSSWMLLHCLEDSARDPLSDHQVISSKASQHTTALQDLMLEPEVEEAFREMAAYR